MQSAAKPTTALPRVMAILLAGGHGTRLHELTAAECKPALSFAGAYRIVDFTMANAVRSGLDRMIVATQYRPETLHRHLSRHWTDHFAPGGLMLRDGHAVTSVGYRGTADAVTANIPLIDAGNVDEVVILAGDHIYQMDYAPMIAAHRATGAVVTVAASTVPVATASAFGVLTTSTQRQIMQFDEKPRYPKGLPNDPSQALVSLGVYVFNWQWLRAALLQDAVRGTSTHDFGHDVLPMAVIAGGAYAHLLPDVHGQKPYWRDVGTLDAYRAAQLDFASGNAPCSLPDVPGAAVRPVAASLRMVDHDIILGGHIRTSKGCNTLLDQSVVLPGACVLPGARLTRVIVAPRTVVPAGLVVGENADDDARWFRRTAVGTTLVTADMIAARLAALRTPARHMKADFHSRIA